MPVEQITKPNPRRAAFLFSILSVIVILLALFAAGVVRVSAVWVVHQFHLVALACAALGA
jgi:hypothetical protein